MDKALATWVDAAEPDLSSPATRTMTALASWSVSVITGETERRDETHRGVPA